MKLIISIINKEDATSTTKDLNEAGYYVTKLSATGGFLKKGNMTILIGTDEDKVPKALEIIDKNTKRRTVKEHGVMKEKGELYENDTMDVSTGGATTFVVEVEHFEKF